MKIKTFNKKNINTNSLFILLLSILILNILFFPKPCMDGCLKGLKLFVFSLFPSLFPFLVICNLIMYFNGAQIYGNLLGPLLCKPLGLPLNCSVVIILSFLCGYPMGAKYTCDLYSEGILDYKTSEKLLNIASNASPLFILGTVAINMMNNKNIGYILLFSNYASCFIMGLLMREKQHTLNTVERKSIHKNETTSSPSFSKAFSLSIDDAITVVLKVAGFVIVFAIITEIIQSATFFKNICLNSTTSTAITSLLLGILEITNGCNNISILSIPLFLKVGLLSFLISFSGICIILQVYTFLFRYNFPIKKYISRKFFQGIISGLLSISIFFITSQKESVLTLSTDPYGIKLSHMFLLSLLLFVLPFCISKIKGLLSK